MLELSGPGFPRLLRMTPLGRFLPDAMGSYGSIAAYREGQLWVESTAISGRSLRRRPAPLYSDQ
ncbi:hypothetical protein EMIT0196P_200006 [Pseudomonas chlororaphis]